MAEFDPHATIEDALEAAAKGLVSSSTEGDQSVQYYSLRDLIEADQYLTRKSTPKEHFGLRFTKLIPPATG